jgi:tRNA pseudouridine38-40 synthase
MRIALTVEYEGTNYHGFQYQNNAKSIQEELESAIARLTGEAIRIKAAGRTDAGVHAKGQVVAFDTDATHSTSTFQRGLNYYLPPDIAIRSAHRVGELFDPRRDAQSRKYEYTIYCSSSPSPLMRRTAYRIVDNLKIDKMQEAAGLLIGRHDFSRFSGPLEHRAGSTVRHVYNALVERECEVVTLSVEGSSFLPHQVRRMAGSLVDVGRDHLSLRDLGGLIEGKSGTAVARSLPALGLCLMEVVYSVFPPAIGELNGNEH